MKTMHDLGRNHHLKRFGITLILVALMAAIGGCAAGTPTSQYTLTIFSTAGGSVTTPGEGTQIYGAGLGVNLVATPDASYIFVNWTGDTATIGDANASSTFIIMNDNYSITANFAEEEPDNPFAGGSGTAADPYKISNWHHLDNVRDYPDKYFILLNHLGTTSGGYADLASATANGGKGWEPIGTALLDETDREQSYIPLDPFTGSFDGRGYEIRDMFIDRLEEDFVGLFGAVYEEAIIKDIGVMDATVTGSLFVGALVGVNGGKVNNSYATGSVAGNDGVGTLVGVNAGTVDNCYATGSVAGNDGVGGLVGGNVGTLDNSYATGIVTGRDVVGSLVGANVGTMSDCYATGRVTGRDVVGGLAGANVGTMSDCYAAGRVTGETSVGGLVGFNEGNVSHCYTIGEVTGRDVVGGLFGTNVGTMSGCYATGRVTGETSVGGLVGANVEDGAVSDCYATGEVTGRDLVGGLTGGNEGTVSNSYATGSVAGNLGVGGLVGFNEGNVSHSYAAGSVTGDDGAGGLVGFSEGTVENSFWDIETSGQATSDGGTGKTTVEMQNIATFEGAGWDICAVDLGDTDDGYTWNIVDGQTYPFLSWEPVS